MCMSALRLLLVATAILVSACGGGGGGGGGGSSSSGGSSSGSGGGAIARGVYSGILGSRSYADPYVIYLDGAGRAEIVRSLMADGGPYSVTRVEGPVHAGSDTYAGTSYAVNGNLLDNGGTVESVTLQLNVTVGQAITGNYSDAEVTSGSDGIDTHYTAYTGTPTTLATLAGTYAFGYSVGGQNYTGTVTISAAGAVSGSDSGGCSYGGTVSADQVDSVFDLSFTTSCVSGTLTGILLAPPGSNTPSLAVNNASGALVATLTRQGT